MTRSPQFFLFISCILFTASCTTSKKVPYLQDAGSYTKQIIPGVFQIKIGNDDMLAIAVSSKDTILAQPFNRVPGGQGYLVNSSGNIVFPIFGELKAAGRTPTALADTIKTKLVNGGYIKDAAVTVRVQNFKVSVMGEVSRPGVFPIASGRVTILEALSLAGDMTVYGKRDRVLIIREEDGQRDMKYIDVNSTALFDSPYFYLRQNDVVYVEPNKAKSSESQYSTGLPVILTGASVLTSLISLIVLISK